MCLPTVKLLAKAMTRVSGGKFLIDGFPRNADNLTGWEKDMAEKVSHWLRSLKTASP